MEKIMLTIDKMPPDARVWVYQSSRIFTDTEEISIKEQGKNFISTWTSHGAEVLASFDIIYNHFIVISIDENNALISGCGLDKGLHFIKKLENLFNITLLDRLQVAYRKEDEILICHLSEFEKLAQQKIIGKSTIVFNNMIASKNAFDTEWEVTLEKSWQNKVLQ